ncbi:hypothetical protein MHU86_20959 [Fragilaria crotonensis]|nr:hypothetical protein MHU86_20959 [Fragilaria crotonensis]
MHKSSSFVLLAVLTFSAESQTLGPTTPPFALTSLAPIKGAPSPTSQWFYPTIPPVSSTPPPSFPIARPSPSQTSGPTSPPVAFAPFPPIPWAPTALFQPFAPISQPTGFGNAPVGSWTSPPVAVSLQVCVQEDERLTACAATVTDACNPSCASIVENSNGDMSECEALGLICAVIQCCNVCVEETNAYGVCLMDLMQCGDTQCSSSSAESNAIAVTIVFFASMVGFGMWW